MMSPTFTYLKGGKKNQYPDKRETDGTCCIAIKLVFEMHFKKYHMKLAFKNILSHILADTANGAHAPSWNQRAIRVKESAPTFIRKKMGF